MPWGMGEEIGTAERRPFLETRVGVQLGRLEPYPGRCESSS